MDNKIKLIVQGLADSQIHSGAYALILAEENGTRRIPIIVGMAEAQSILIALERIAAPRPLTHDLFTCVFHAFDITMKEVYIYKCEDGVFFSELVLDKKGGGQVKIDSRTSDAIAIALRVNCEIFTSMEVINECGVKLEEPGADPEQDEDSDWEDAELEEMEDKPKRQEKLNLLDIDNLNKRLQIAIKQERYEQAKLYRDELRRREGGKK